MSQWGAGDQTGHAPVIMIKPHFIICKFKTLWWFFSYLYRNVKIVYQK